MLRNPFRAAALIAVPSALIVLAAWLIWGDEGLRSGVVLVLGVVGLVCFFGDSLVLRAMRARPVGEFEQPELHRVVRELATEARQPMPRLYLSPTPAPNAFAVGRGPRSAGVCCTTGLLRLLSERELRAVVAHELAHVRNRDTLVSSVAVGLATIIVSLTALALLLPLGDSDDEGPGLLEGLLFLGLGPLAALVIRSGAGRGREYRADEAAARLTGDPLSLASALRKIEVGARTHPLPMERRLLAAGHQMIANPFPRRGMCRLFDAHPPTPERIRRLRALDERWRIG
ncbi:M48 family metalloprotease [Nocardiopsis sp. CNT-189]|uniref:M48 family metalloprotease n=1 Tax=Nocardiopsis oceanisediminis TaxID=2816862 RepID=UPI003B36381B